MKLSAKKHKGPRNTRMICAVHIIENGPRPFEPGAKQAMWDAALRRRSPVIATSLDNGVTELDDMGYLVPKRRGK